MIESTHNDERYGVDMLDLALRAMLHVFGMLNCSESASLVDMVANGRHFGVVSQFLYSNLPKRSIRVAPY